MHRRFSMVSLVYGVGQFQFSNLEFYVSVPKMDESNSLLLGGHRINEPSYYSAILFVHSCCQIRKKNVFCWINLFFAVKALVYVCVSLLPYFLIAMYKGIKHFIMV